MANKTCSGCRHWGGDETADMGACTVGIGQTPFSMPACGSFAALGQVAPPPAETDWLGLRRLTQGPMTPPMARTTLVRNRQMAPVSHPPVSAFPANPQPGEYCKPAGYPSFYVARVLKTANGSVLVDWIEQ